MEREDSYATAERHDFVPNGLRGGKSLIEPR